MLQLDHVNQHYRQGQRGSASLVGPEHPPVSPSPVVRQVGANPSDSEQGLGSCSRVGQHWAHAPRPSPVLVLVSPTQVSPSTRDVPHTKGFMLNCPEDEPCAPWSPVGRGNGGTGPARPLCGMVHCNHPGDSSGTEAVAGTGLIAKDADCAYLILFLKLISVYFTS